MSAWNGTTIVRWEPRTFDDRPGWVALDCGCSAGIQWGGDEPRPCADCWESGWRYVHAASGCLAQWPGGLLRGRATADETAQARVIDSARRMVEP